MIDINLHFAFQLVVGGLVFCLFLILVSSKPESTHPGPPGWPIIGNLLDLRSTRPLLKHPARTFLEWSKQYRSDSISLRIPGAPMLVLHSRKDVAELLVKRSGIYSDRPRTVMLNEIVQGDWLLPFMPYNDRFRATRKLFHQAVSNHPIIRPSIITAVRHLLLRLLHTSEGHDKEFRFMTGEFALLSTYGIRPMTTDDPYIKRTSELVTIIANSSQRDNYLVDVFPILKWIPAWMPGAAFKRNALKSRKLVQDALMLPWQAVQDKLSQGTAKSCLASCFIESSDINTEYDLGVDLMRSALGNLYLGASDSTMTGLWSCILALALHPEVQRKGRAIADSRLDGRLPDFSDFGTMPYVDAIVHESLRWNPVTPLGAPHCAKQDDHYNGRVIKKGTMVFANIWALLKDEMSYGKDTDKFIPERWLHPDGTFNADMDTDTPFGFGRRICPGKDIAVEAIWLTVASLLVTFDIGRPVDKDGIPLRAEGIDGLYSQRPLNVAPFFRNSFTPRSASVGTLIRDCAEEA